jgi:Reverse transcriptase (RNA-dependent DNA polymerase)
MTDSIVRVMPNLYVVLERCSGKRYYAVFDFVKGFWQLPLHKDSQEILSYMTDRGVYTPTRVPQGCTDAALHFQATMEMVLAVLLYKNVLVWIDDVLVFADTVDELFDVLELMFKLLNEYGLKLSPKKSEVFLTQVKWCGRIIDADGIRHDPERIEALCNIPEPATAAELQQFICASNWMRESLPDYARLVDPLQQLLDTALKGSKKTKKAATGIRVTFTSVERANFIETKQLLQRAATLAFPDPKKRM